MQAAELSSKPERTSQIWDTLSSIAIWRSFKSFADISASQPGLAFADSEDCGDMPGMAPGIELISSSDKLDEAGVAEAGVVKLREARRTFQNL